MWATLLKIARYVTNKRFLISEEEKIVRLLLLSLDINVEIEGIFSALKRLKTWFRSTIGHNRLHPLMLMHVHKNILDNIILADITNEFVDRKESCKQTFRHFSQNYS